LTPPAQFCGEVYFPVVRVPSQHFRVLIKTPFLTLDSSSGRTNLTIHGEKLEGARLNLDDWQHYLRLMEIISEGEFEINIESNERSLPPITCREKLQTPPPQDPWIPEVIRRSEKLFKFAAVEGAETTLAELHDSAEMVNTAYVHLFEPSMAPVQTFNSTDQAEIPLTDFEFLQADYLVVAGVALAYACRVTMRPEPAGNQLIWRQVDTKPERLVKIEKTVDAFKTFVSDTREQSGLQNTMTRDLSTGPEGIPGAHHNS